ncbi:MAG: phage holin family protein [Bacillota bacterium]
MAFSVILSACGGIVHILSDPDTKKTTIILITESFTSMFIGMLIFLLLQNYISTNILAGLCGLSGYIGIPVLQNLTRFFFKILKKIEVKL